jgi:hypothetical protein
VDVDSFSDVAPEVRKEAVPDDAAEPAVEAEVTVPTEAPVAAEVSAVDISQPAPSRDEASPEFAKELELTVQRGEHPTEHAPLVEVREVVPEDQTPSPSLAAFNKSFGTSHRGKLLSVGFETTSVGSKTSKILTLWKSSMMLMNQEGRVRDNLKELLQVLRKGLILLPKPPPRLRVELLLVRLNRSLCSISVRKVRPFSVLFRAFPRFFNFDLRLS